MTFPEGPDLDANVRNSARIVWKNVDVIGPGGRLAAYTTIANFTKEPLTARLAFQGPKGLIVEQSAFDVGPVLAHLGPQLFEIWRRGGSAAHGVEVVGPDTIRALRPDSWIGGLVLPPNALHTIAVQVQGHETVPGSGVHVLDVVQYTEEGESQRLVGAQRVLLKTVARHRHRRRHRHHHVPEGVLGDWRHTHEEDTDEVIVFRRVGYAFGPSRGRRGFEIRADGSFVRHEIALTDGTRAIPARWEAEGGLATIHVQDDEGGSDTLVIVSIEDDILRIRR